MDQPTRAEAKQAKQAEKQAIEDIRAASRAFAEQALSTLTTCIDANDAPWPSKVKAAEIILDRGFGRPEQTTNVTLSVIDQMTDGEQKAVLAALAALREQDEDQPRLN